MSAVADETAADVPVRDITLNLNAVGVLPESLVAQNARARQTVSKVSREELEDRYLRLHEENLILKQHAHKQEDKIKRMATKLIRLVKDKKRMEQISSGGRAGGGRDVEMEEMMEELQERVQELEKQNESLRQRLLAAKQQLQLQTRRATPYGHVQSRINTGLRRLRGDSPTIQQRPQTPGRAVSRHTEADMSARPPQGLLPRYGHSLLDDARAEIRNLENVIENQRTQMEEMEKSAEMLRDQLRRKEREYEESLLHLREQQASGQRSTIKDNVEMIKLQKQLSEKGNAFTVLEGRFHQLQQSQRTLKASHDAVMAKVDELTAQLKDERLRSLDLESQLQSRALEQRRIEELQERIQDLEKERDLLKENCDKLVNSAFDVSQEQKWKTREQQLKLQIAQLELALKSDLTDKNEILDKIKAERELNEKLSQENKELQLRYLEQKEQLDEIKDRMAFFTKESEIDAAELSEALMLIKVRKTQKNGELSFLERVDESMNADLERSMKELQATYAETVQELEKTRNMLIIQHKINKDYQAEVEAVTRKMEDLRLENELKQEKLAQLLDVRAAKIKKLEAQLKDIAYGTKAHVFRPDVTDEDTADEFDETVHLARGENLLEIHLGTARFSQEALEKLGDKEPSTFCTYAFYDYELQSTSVLRSPRPSYAFTSRYLVRVDELFLHYLHTSAVSVETQLAEGMEFRTVAAGHVRLNQVLEREGKVFGTMQLVGLNGEAESFGTLDYWLRLRVPMEQAIRLYKERVKAVSYLSSGLRESAQAPSPPSSSSVLAEEGMNELYVTVHRCSSLKSRGPHRQPNPYVIYTLYDFPDHDTPIVASSDEPQFEDRAVYPMAMNPELDSYLRTESLTLYVFDDLEGESELYLGKARVPLISLAHDKAITGTFELTDPTGLPRGHIDVTLKWKFTYLPPPGGALTPEQARFIAKEPPVKLSAEEVAEEMKEEEQEEMKAKNLSPSPQPGPSEIPMPKPRQRTLTKPASKKVSFMDVTAPENLTEKTSPPDAEQQRTKSSALPVPKTVKVVEVAQTAVPANDDEEEDEEESHFSEGQVIAVSSQSLSDESDISEDLPPQEEGKFKKKITPIKLPPSTKTETPPPLLSVRSLMSSARWEETDLDESILSDSDDCIVPPHSSQSRKRPTERIRVEIVSLSLRPDSRVALDSSVVRLFVEYSFLDMPSVETPLSLPKPTPGHSIHFNYSNVVHVDVEKNQARRHTLRAVLEGRDKQLENIKFTVVSDPPEEEEQERECEDVGVAYLRIPDILDRQSDMTDVNLNIVDVQDSSEVVGSLKVTVEALEALRSIMEDPDRDHSLPALTHLI